jgi:DegV family protein with EDD domain
MNVEELSMKKVKVIATSSSCLDYYHQPNNVGILRLKIIDGDKTLNDGVDIDAPEFYERLRKDPNWVPKTQQPNAMDVIELIESYKDENYDEFFIVSISSELSGTFNSIRLAAEELAGKIKVTPYDSKTVCFSEGYLALEAEKLFNAGKTTEEVIEHLDRLKNNNTIFFAVDNLTQLVKNGRLTGAKAFLGKLLDIKPILQVEPSGKIVSIAKKRNIKAAFKLIPEFIKEYVGDKKYYAHILYAGNPTLKTFFIEQLEESLGLKNLVEAPATPVVGCHVGGDIVGIGIFILD